MMCKKLMAEGVGTFWLVLGGVGAAALAASGVGTLGVALAFGLSLMTIAYAIGPVSGCHINPAVTIGMVAAGRFDSKDALGYIIAQVIGATAAAWLIGYIGEGHNIGMIGANGFDAHSPGGYSMHAVLITEIVMTAMFMFIILGTTEKGIPAGFAPLAIGLALALIHIVTINISGTSVNPARSTGPALIVQGWALEQLWLFWVAPIIGAIVGAGIYRKWDNCD